MKKNGFVFIETIVVICVLTVSLMSLYANYSQIVTNVKELNTYDTTEYVYKTYFIKKLITNGKLKSPTNIYNYDNCVNTRSPFSDDEEIRYCIIPTNTIKDKSEIYHYDAYMLDYLNSQDFSKIPFLLVVEYKKQDLNDNELYYTYISSVAISQ